MEIDRPLKLFLWLLFFEDSRIVPKELRHFSLALQLSAPHQRIRDNSGLWTTSLAKIGTFNNTIQDDCEVTFKRLPKIQSRK